MIVSGATLFIGPLGGFNNTKSLTVYDSTDTLTRTQGTGSSRRKMTFSFWFKTNDSLSQYNAVFNTFAGHDAIILIPYDTGGVSVGFNYGSDGAVTTTGVTIANNIWYHAVVQIDTANATASNRCKVFIDGTDRSSTTTTVTQNYDTYWGLNANSEYITNGTDTVSFLFDELAKIDNQVLAPSSFATAGSPIDLSGLTFGSQGYWLRFETGVGSTAGNDSSGNGLNFTSTYDDADFSTDVP